MPCFLSRAFAGNVYLIDSNLNLATNMNIGRDLDCSSGGCPDSKKTKALFYEVESKKMCPAGEGPPQKTTKPKPTTNPTKPKTTKPTKPKTTKPTKPKTTKPTKPKTTKPTKPKTTTKRIGNDVLCTSVNDFGSCDRNAILCQYCAHSCLCLVSCAL